MTLIFAKSATFYVKFGEFKERGEQAYKVAQIHRHLSYHTQWL